MCRDGVYGMVVARWGMGGVGMVFDNGLRCEATRLNFRGTRPVETTSCAAKGRKERNRHSKRQWGRHSLISLQYCTFRVSGDCGITQSSAVAS
jgi:hypothetical protein